MNSKEKIEYMSVNNLVPFKDHPFKMRDGEEKEQLLASIKEQGTIEPLIVRHSSTCLLYTSFIIRDAKRRIARAIGIDENISNNALRVLFGPMDMQMSLESEEEREFEKNNKLIDKLSLREYNAFLVNNRDRLVELFSQISANDIADIEETDVIESEWGIPSYQYYKQHKKIQSTAILNKNVFENYGNNILIHPNRTCLLYTSCSSSAVKRSLICKHVVFHIGH